MQNKYTLTFNTDADEDPATVLSVIIEAIEEGEEYGETKAGPWELCEEGSGVEIDRRAKVAAANLMVAFDLPQSASEAAQQMIKAARLCPGITTNEIGNMQGSMNLHNKRSVLEKAQALIAEMLLEAGN